MVVYGAILESEDVRSRSPPGGNQAPAHRRMGSVGWLHPGAARYGFPAALPLGAHLDGIRCLRMRVLAANRGQCPLTDWAARFTEDRAANFDIYLPDWLARNNKAIFGTLFVVNELIVLWRWLVHAMKETLKAGVALFRPRVCCRVRARHHPHALGSPEIGREDG